MFASVGVSSAPNGIGLTPEDVRTALPRAIYYRLHYTVLDVTRELGWFEEIVDDVFTPGGLWQ